MLSYLSIRNLAVIERLELELEPGLTVLTGETGAGKSMVLNGLLLLLGAKAPAELVRAGEKTLDVEGVWTREAWREAAAEFIDEEDEEETEVVLRRSVTLSPTSKRDRMFINGRVVPRRSLAEAAPSVVNLSSQHEYVSLLRKREHRAILDRFAGLDDELEKMAVLSGRFEAVRRTVEKLENEAEQRELRGVALREQLELLEGAELQEDEEVQLHERIARLSHAVEISQALQQVVGILYEEDGDVTSGIALAEKTLASVEKYEPMVKPMGERLESSRVELEDVVEQLRSLHAGLEVEPHQLDHLQERLAMLQKLKRRFRVQESDQLLQVFEDLRTELGVLEGDGLSLEEQQRILTSLRDETRQAADELHRQRVKAGQRLALVLLRNLSELELQKAAFEVAVEYDEETIGATGGDDVEFLFSANPGQPPMSLGKIASGGELSRVLLAFKAALADAYPVPTYVFDEIDSGVGGKTALAVGRLLADMARHHQVLCITHTAQLAAFADHHIVVTKDDEGESTRAVVTTLLTSAQREEELARMLSGMEESRSARHHARELLQAAALEKRGGGSKPPPRLL